MGVAKEDTRSSDNGSYGAFTVTFWGSDSKCTNGVCQDIPSGTQHYKP